MSDDPLHCTCAVLRGASRHLSRRYDAALAGLGLSLNQYSILARLDRLGAADVGKLAELLVMDRSTLGHLIRPLQARTWLETRRDPDDRRRTVLALTSTGRAVLDAARPIVAEHQRGLETALGEEDAATLVALLKRVAALNR